MNHNKILKITPIVIVFIMACLFTSCSKKGYGCYYNVYNQEEVKSQDHTKLKESSDSKQFIECVAP